MFTNKPVRLSILGKLGYVLVWLSMSFIIRVRCFWNRSRLFIPKCKSPVFDNPCLLSQKICLALKFQTFCHCIWGLKACYSAKVELRVKILKYYLSIVRSQSNCTIIFNVLVSTALFFFNKCARTTIYWQLLSFANLNTFKLKENLRNFSTKDKCVKWIFLLSSFGWKFQSNIFLISEKD